MSDTLQALRDTAARLLEGTLYERYYGLLYARDTKVLKCVDLRPAK